MTKPEVEFPVETAIGEIGSGQEFEGLVGDDINNRTNHIGPVFLDLEQ